MNITVNRRPPDDPPIDNVTIVLTPKEARDLVAFAGVLSTSLIASTLRTSGTEQPNRLRNMFGKIYDDLSHFGLREAQ